MSGIQPPTIWQMVETIEAQQETIDHLILTIMRMESDIKQLKTIVGGNDQR